MSDHSTVATDLTSQYVAQVANDLERNAKEQERVGAEIDGLRQQLAALQRDHALLVKMQQALDLAADTSEGTADASGDTAVAEPAAATEPSEKDGAAEPAEETAVSGHATVPAPRSRGGVKSGAAKPKRERKKVTAGGAGKAAGAARTGGAARTTGAAKPAGPAKSAGARSTRKPATPKPTGKAAAVKTARKAPAKAAESAQGDAPKLVDLVRRHLDEQKEPRSAAEVATALGQAHPGRTIKVTVIRSTLEGLVARNQAQRSKQGTSVFYTAPDGSTPAPERAADAQS
ncbi:hypothetical protein OOK48_02110 [Streptomyces viridodiastaticus]|uniref:hypothetical protein n=1 Tax=Streptomyces albogriseolus TaxID=1887 RepID=UPI00225C36AD|nr:hypothetical protein [Streptomyces viridodiastaticus]MCX4565141.1 hypothetical protein [Streptomyces viridodiastaticus]